MITIWTPDNYEFVESEIPITITSDDDEFVGITLDPLVKRYIFHVHIWDCDCSLPTPPLELYFTEFIPNSYYI